MNQREKELLSIRLANVVCKPNVDFKYMPINSVLPVVNGGKPLCASCVEEQTQDVEGGGEGLLDRLL